MTKRELLFALIAPAAGHLAVWLAFFCVDTKADRGVWLLIPGVPLLLWIVLYYCIKSRLTAGLNAARIKISLCFSGTNIALSGITGAAISAADRAGAFGNEFLAGLDYMLLWAMLAAAAAVMLITDATVILFRLCLTGRQKPGNN